MRLWFLLGLVKVVLLVGLIFAVANDWSYWWVFGVPWMIVCVVGIVLMLPVVFVLGIFVGAAQADWMSDGFVVVVFFVMPTVLSFVDVWIFRRKSSGRLQDEVNGS